MQEVQRRQEQLSHEGFDNIVALRDWMRTVYCRRERLRNGRGDGDRTRAEYGRLDREAKLELLRHAIATDPIPETLQQDVLRALAAWMRTPGEERENADESGKHKAFAHTATLMLTWQGVWGRKDVGEPFASEMSVILSKFGLLAEIRADDVRAARHSVRRPRSHHNLNQKRRTAYAAPVLV